MSSPTATAYRSINILRENSTDSGDQKTYQLASYPYLKIKHVYQNSSELDSTVVTWTEDKTLGTLTFAVARPVGADISVTYYGKSVELINLISASYARSVEATAGTFSLTLDNNQGNYAAIKTGTTYDWGFSLNDVIVIKLGYDENEEIDFVGHVKKAKYNLTTKGRTVIVSGKDKNADLLNSLVTKVYDAKSASYIVTELLKAYAPDLERDEITTTIKSLDKVWHRKRLYECLNELALDESTDMGNFTYYVDTDDEFVFKVKPTSYDYTLTVGEDISTLHMTNGIFDFVNVLIINGGKDLNGWSVIDMYYDEDAIALAKGQQTVRYEHRANITKQMKTGYMYTETPSLTAGNTVATVTNTPVAYFKEVAEDSGSGYRVLQNSGSDAWTEDLTAGTITFINAHTGTIRIRYYYKSGDISNEEFREEAREEIRRQAELTVKESGGLRWKGTSGVRGTLEYNVGNKIKIDDEYSFGDDNPLEELTIKSISQSYNTGGWKTTLSLEEVLE